MSRATQRDYREKRRPSSVDSDSDSNEDTFTHIQCWIPAANIDLVVLATYLKQFIDDTATLKSSAHPQNPSKAGYTIGARSTLSVAGCQDIILDSRAWEKEKSSRDYRKDPYSYNESDTWHNRKKRGPSPGHTNPRRRRKEPQADAQQSKHVRADDRKGEKGAGRDGRSGRRHDGEGDVPQDERDWSVPAAEEEDRQYRVIRNKGDNEQEDPSRSSRSALQNLPPYSVNPRTLPTAADTMKTPMSSKALERHPADGEPRHAAMSSRILDRQHDRGIRESDRYGRGDASGQRNDIERLPDRRHPIGRDDASAKRNDVERLPDRRRPIQTG